MNLITLLCVFSLATGQDDTPAKVVERLGSEDPEVREEATRRLRSLDGRAIPALRDALKDGDAEVRARAGALIWAIEWEGTLNPYLLARYPELADRFRRMDHWGVLEWVGSRPRWTWRLSEPFEAYAIKLLEQHDPNLAKLGVRYFDLRPDFPPRLSRRPVRALAERIARWEPEKSNDERRGWLVQLATVAIRVASPIDRPHLLRRRGAHPDGETVLRILRARAGDRDALASMRSTLKSGPAWARPLAIHAVRLARYGPARPEVLSLLDDKRLVWPAMHALTEIADTSCAERITRLLRERPDFMTYRALVRAQAREAVPDLLRIAIDPSSKSWQEAANALGELGTSEQFDALFDTLSRKDRAYVHGRIAAMLSNSAQIPRLLDLLSVPPTDPRRSATHWFSHVRDPDAQRVVLRRLTEEKVPASRRILLKAVTSSRFLESIGPEVESVLEQIAAKPSDPLSPTAAATLLARNGEKALETAERVALESEHPLRPLLTLLARHPSDRLAKRMGNLAANRTTSEYALQYLERLGSEAARAEVREVLAGAPEERVFLRASAALARLEGRCPKEFKNAVGAPYSWVICPDLLLRDVEGARDILRVQVKAQGVASYLYALRNWAHPEMAPALTAALRRYQATRGEKMKKEEIPRFWVVTGAS